MGHSAPVRNELDLTNFDLLLEYIRILADFIIIIAGHIGGINAALTIQ